jgi:hypothetical protein
MIDVRQPRVGPVDLIPHRRCWQKCLASSSRRIVGVQLTLWGGLKGLGGNVRCLPGFVGRHINGGLIQNSAKQDSDYRIKHRNASYYQLLARFEIRM